MKSNVPSREFKEIKARIVPILKQSGVKRAGIFGSYARGEQTKDSDLDILIEVKGRKFSLFDLSHLELELEKTLRKKVDVLTYNGKDPLLRERILKEEIKII
jgi:predicted nucleotidyltransferase